MTPRHGRRPTPSKRILMFDPVTNDAVRLWWRSIRSPSPVDADHRTSLLCRVCRREMRPEEEVQWVGNEPHCHQCHDMLGFELNKERELDARHRRGETRWEKKD